VTVVHILDKQKNFCLSRMCTRVACEASSLAVAGAQGTISLRFCLNVNLLILSANLKYRVKIMNARIVDIRRSFPRSETFPKLQK
jgi:hypothetical protein